MNENIQAFLNVLAEDKALQAKLAEAQTPDEAYALASSIQEGFTKEELIETMMKLKALAPEEEELTDADLEKVAGGGSAGQNAAAAAASGALAV
jgi:predicted ribosomally synthesized peptide with nif11-like leader